MRKLLLILAATSFTTLSFAASLNMATLQCKGMKINASTTLQQVQTNCLIKDQKMDKSKGMYQVTFTNTATGKTEKTVTCNFVSNDPKSLVNGCK